MNFDHQFAPPHCLIVNPLKNDGSTRILFPFLLFPLLFVSYLRRAPLSRARGINLHARGITETRDERAREKEEEKKKRGARADD